MIHPCKCKSYNGGQCFNCLNGAHDLCADGCKTKRSKQVGVMIVVKRTKRSNKTMSTMIEVNAKRSWDKNTDGEAKRPYRIWDANKKRDVRYRYYAIKRNALDGALLEVRWGKIGTALEVYDCRYGTLLGTFVRHATTLSFTKP